MTCYLINPKEDFLETAGDRVPLGLLYIASVWKDTRIFDMNHESLEYLLNQIDIDEPELIGISCLTEGILRTIGKNQTKEQIRNAFKLCKDYGIETKGFFILGLPGETEETTKQTIDFIQELKTYGMKEHDVYPLMPFPGTEIYTNPSKFNIRIVNHDYTKYIQAGKEVIVPTETLRLKADRIKELILEARK